MMSTSPTGQAVPAGKIDRKAIVAANPRIASSARWFWWIAGLSLINSVLIHSGSSTSFLAGLGFTLVADSIFQAFKPAAFVIDALGVGFFYAMGAMALRGYRWAFIVGGIFYALDGAIYLYFQAFMPLAFHAWALFAIWTGGVALNNVLKTQPFEPQQPITSAEPLPLFATPIAEQPERQP